MTSREALENWYNTESPRIKAYEYEQHYRLIKKDLEILEILKKYIRVNELKEKPQIMTGPPDVDIVLNVVKKALDGSIFLDLMLQEDAKKIKEWLNDNIRIVK